ERGARRPVPPVPLRHHRGRRCRPEPRAEQAPHRVLARRPRTHPRRALEAALALHLLDATALALRRATAVAVLAGQLSLLRMPLAGLAARRRLLVELRRLERRTATRGDAVHEHVHPDRTGSQLEPIAGTDLLARF